MVMNSYVTFHDLWIHIWIHVYEEYREIIPEFRCTKVPDVEMIEINLPVNLNLTSEASSSSNCFAGPAYARARAAAARRPPRARSSDCQSWVVSTTPLAASRVTQRVRLTQAWASRCAAAQTASVESPLELPALQGKLSKVGHCWL